MISSQLPSNEERGKRQYQPESRVAESKRPKRLPKHFQDFALYNVERL